MLTRHDWNCQYQEPKVVVQFDLLGYFLCGRSSVFSVVQGFFACPRKQRLEPQRTQSYTEENATEGKRFTKEDQIEPLPNQSRVLDSSFLSGLCGSSLRSLRFNLLGCFQTTSKKALTAKIAEKGRRGRGENQLVHYRKSHSLVKIAMNFNNCKSSQQH